MTSVFCDVTLYTGYVKIGLEINRIERVKIITMQRGKMIIVHINNYVNCNISETNLKIYLQQDLEGNKLRPSVTTMF